MAPTPSGAALASMIGVCGGGTRKKYVTRDDEFELSILCDGNDHTHTNNSNALQTLTGVFRHTTKRRCTPSLKVADVYATNMALCPSEAVETGALALRHEKVRLRVGLLLVAVALEVGNVKAAELGR